MITEIENFLDEQECDKLIQLIDSNHERSGVAGEGGEFSTYSEHRTSSSSYLDSTDPFVISIKNKIASFLGYDAAKGEAIQGQLYEPGQYFKRHNDWFQGDSYETHCSVAGNRTDTFMIYLNEGMEGGGTDFPLLARNITPKKGKAVHWRNMRDGKPIQAVEHEGQEVISGKKYIITSWWREKDWDVSSRIAEVKSPDMKIVKSNTFSDKFDFPKFTQRGFDVVRVPDDAWKLVQKMYNSLKDSAHEEIFQDKEKFIVGAQEKTSELLDLSHVAEDRTKLHNMLLPLHEGWSDQRLVPSFIYGIRSYLRGSALKSHVDKIGTHHISSIIIVDKNLKCGCQHRENADDWPLNIKDHNGDWHEVYAGVGDMILYESATCEHGREELFGGTYFRNMFVHYQLADWKYEPK